MRLSENERTVLTMTKYIERDALVEWLKRVPLKDLSDGLGLCRIIMEDDFKKAIKNMPKGVIVDAVPVVRCKDCKYFKTRLCENEDNYDEWFCADGERKEDK